MLKLKKFSPFDIGFAIALAVVALLGAGAWYYLSGQLATAQDDVTNAKADYDKFSTKADIVVSKSNGTILQANSDLITNQVNPMIKSKLLAQDNKLSSVEKEDPVAWKHDLDEEVRRLTSAAKLHGVALPPNFYFGFARYLNISPGDEQTTVLSKQLLGVEQITNILLTAPVKSITAIRRTFEEDPHTGPGGVVPLDNNADHLGGFSMVAPANAYTSYPFEVEFDTTSENLRPVVNGLLKTPYVFILRSISVTNSVLNSPQLNDLVNLAGPPPAPPVVDTSPGDVASAPAPTRGPQYLFGSSLIHVTARVDMIEWTAGLVH